jgi:hypothetical protein
VRILVITLPRSACFIATVAIRLIIDACDA